MANTFYSYSAYILPSSNATLTALKEHLNTFYQESDNGDQPEIVLSNNQITITFNEEYRFYINLSEEKHINEEALEIAQDLEEDWNEKPFDKEKLKTAQKRFEVWGDKDFDMDYFNDSLFIIDQIEKFSDIIIFQNM
ncbi:hypothetical protein HYN56_22890 [Flavobacterium crocinum]|uniref:Uncharacterized protein n=1 Tax=Flavobacterium crocinum TaxID=2183896 RepID=A0A2S1YS70_9FLAO|nr:hypothetical protein [Flavobacterium crocinum]AWK06921.1 hypothetical protein HYN56_22890 [Flavobacterium crocinum]